MPATRTVRPRTILPSLIAFLALFALVLPFPLAAPPVAAHQAGTAEVKVVDFAFEPQTLTVPAGTTVTWTNTSSRVHTVTADDGSFDSARLDAGETFSQVFDTPGTYTYHCGYHPDMTGTIVVTAAEDVTPPPTPTTTAAVTPESGNTAQSSAGEARNLVPVEQSRLAHIHAGTCDELGIVVYSLPNIRTYRVDEGDGAGVGAIEFITGTADVALDDLFGEPFSVHIHESAQNKGTYLACADVGGRPAAPWSAADGLYLEAREQNDSGYSGFAALTPNSDGGTTIAVSIAASPDSVAEAAAQEAPPPSTTYTSPTFGYTIGYGPTWQESENVSNNGRDRFVLFNGTSYITFTGEAAFGGNTQACVDAFVKQLTADPNVSNLRLATDDNGAPLEGGTEATGNFAIYDHDYDFTGRTEPYTLFVGCIPLRENEAVIAIVQNVPTAEYNEQLALREALLRGLTLAQ